MPPDGPDRGPIVEPTTPRWGTGCPQPGDHAQELVLHLPGDRLVQLAEPSTLVVFGDPDRHRRVQVVELHASVVRSRPQVGEGPAELGVPQQRG